MIPTFKLTSTRKIWSLLTPVEQRGAPYKVYNIGNHQPVELMSFIKTIEDSLGQEAQKNFLPMQQGDVEPLMPTSKI